MATSKFIGAKALAIKFYEKGLGPKCAAHKANKATVEDYKNEGIEPTTKVSRVSPSQVSAIVSKLEIAHNYNKALTPKQIEKIRTQREAGYTLKDLASIYGMSESTIRNYCLMPIFPGVKTVKI